jgi:transcriptional repressor NrdR
VHCPACRADDTKVVDSRLAEEGAAVRRRRHCLSCAHRFTTFERVDEVPLVVLKSDGRVEPFDRAEVTSAQVGLAVLDRLRTIDEVAYLRFASVYKNFDAAVDFHREIELLTKGAQA